MNTMHLFAGRGGGLLADLILGHNPIIAVEWNHEACENLRERAEEGWYPNLYVWEGDVRLFNSSEYKGRVDCIHAGFPCQDVSHSGKQAGVGEGTRSGLYREVLRIAGEIRPKYIFLENVAAIVTNGLDTVLRDISKMGYDARWCIVSASDVGANHQRERWWCLCTLRHTNGNTNRKSTFTRRKWQQPMGVKEIETRRNIRRRILCNGRKETFADVGYSKNKYDKGNMSQTRKVWGTSGKSRRPDSPSRVYEAGIKYRQRTRIYADASDTNGTISRKIKKDIELGTIRNKSTYIRSGNNNAGIQQSDSDRFDWWLTSSGVRRIYDGISDKLHKDQVRARLFGLGNAQVPLACATAWKILTRDLEY